MESSVLTATPTNKSPKVQLAQQNTNAPSANTNVEELIQRKLEELAEEPTIEDTKPGAPSGQPEDPFTTLIK